MPHDFSSHVLRRYFEATGWNEANSYLHLTSSSAALLDFTIPPGVSLSFSASPAPTFFNTYRLRALPTLRGAFGYIFASIDPERLAVDGTAGPAQLDIGTSSARVRFKDVIDRFKVHEVPRRPSGREAVWQGGKRTDSRDYLLYGCIHVPSGRLDALYTTRLAETWQLLITAVSSPPRLSSAASTLADLPNQQPPPISSSQYQHQQHQLAGQGYGQGHPNAGVHGQLAHPSAAAAAPAVAPDSGASSYGSGSVGPPGSTNLQFTLQQDTGRWCTEYSYSADDALWGFRVLHNFGWPGTAAGHTSAAAAQRAETLATSEDALGAGLRIGGVGSAANDEPLVGLIDSLSVAEGGTALKVPEASARTTQSTTADDLTVGGGLRGRFSAGAELFFSAVEKSAGLSTGIRFMTLPDPPATMTPEGDEIPPEARVPSQPPTIIAATLNPMLGHLSTAYAARMSRNAVVGSRFDFNVYSYESEFTIGAEYWLRSQASSVSQAASTPEPEPEIEQEMRLERREPVLIAPRTEASLRDSSPPPPSVEAAPKREASLRPEPAVPTTLSSIPTPATEPTPTTTSGSSSFAFTAQETSPTLLSHATTPSDTVNGVLKFRFSSSSDVALLWEGRLRNCLVNLGVRADLTSRSAPIKSVGLDVLYFGTAGAEDAPAPAPAATRLGPRSDIPLDKGLNVD
ncbi:Mitochondrial distribution and morphology protein 10 [Tilletia horrida]|nr:Mitochondrial distribution and morphology protein 10 [Tilletia horrida]